jgi:membrane associated rhomboid family serine protease
METAVRTTDRVSEANEWVLVLAAAGIPHRLDRDDAGWAIVVPDPEVRRAERALRAYDAENRVPTAPAPPAPAPGRAAWTVGLLAGALLLGFFALTGPPAPGSRWFDRGAAAAGPMLEGQPWRAVTALTLHVDTLHALSNAIATALLLPPIVERLGPGAGVALVLLAGAAANLVAAEAQSPDHVAAGASTATFAAIGILAGLRIRTPHAPGRSRRGWVVLGAALLLLAMLGTGPGSDVLGHAAGLASGVVVGLAATLFPRPLSRRIQRGLLAALALLVAACWHLALAR